MAPEPEERVVKIITPQMTFSASERTRSGLAFITQTSLAKRLAKSTGFRQQDGCGLAKVW